MHPRSTNRRDRLAGALADGQHGVAGREQLLRAGASRESIKGSLAAGRLRPMFRGVYAVGHAAVSQEGWCKAALLACGHDSVLGHRTACLLWDFRRTELFPLSVVVPGNRGRKIDRIQVRRMRLDPGEWMVLDGLRLTTPARPIVDMAGELRPRGIRRLVERAQDLNASTLPRSGRSSSATRAAPAAGRCSTSSPCSSPMPTALAHTSSDYSSRSCARPGCPSPR